MNPPIYLLIHVLTPRARDLRHLAHKRTKKTINANKPTPKPNESLTAEPWNSVAAVGLSRTWMLKLPLPPDAGDWVETEGRPTLATPETTRLAGVEISPETCGVNAGGWTTAKPSIGVGALLD